MKLDGDGAIALVDRETCIRQSVLAILSTPLGKRPLYPDFGCNLSPFLRLPPNGTTRSQIAREAKRSLQQLEPRIDSIAVAVDLETRSLQIRYRDRLTYRHHSVTYPLPCQPQ